MRINITDPLVVGRARRCPLGYSIVFMGSKDIDINSMSQEWEVGAEPNSYDEEDGNVHTHHLRLELLGCNCDNYARKSVSQSSETWTFVLMLLLSTLYASNRIFL